MPQRRDKHSFWGTTRNTVIFTIFGFTVKVTHKSGSNLLSRFGGGWQFALGVEASSSTVILNCAVFYVRISRALQTRKT